jgi:hypothetical protein
VSEASKRGRTERASPWALSPAPSDCSTVEYYVRIGHTLTSLIRANGRVNLLWEEKTKARVGRLPSVVEGAPWPVPGVTGGCPRTRRRSMRAPRKNSGCATWESNLGLHIYFRLVPMHSLTLIRHVSFFSHSHPTLTPLSSHGANAQAIVPALLLFPPR